MKINLICVGNIKDKNMTQLFESYFNKIKPFINIEYFVIKEEKINNELNQSEINIALKKEAEKIIKYIKHNSFSFLMSIKGCKFDSFKFAKILKSKLNDPIYKEVNFIIGSSHGLDDSIYKLNNCSQISFSDLTFPHQLFAILLVEQIYRAFMINNNHKYHK